MTANGIKALCLKKQNELIEQYFGNIVHEAAIERPETIGDYTKDLPLKIEAEYRSFLEKLWEECAPEGMKGTPLVLEEQRLRTLMTESDREGIDAAYSDATKQTLWERITSSNHEDVTYYKGLLKVYANELMTVMSLDFLEEITGEHMNI